MIKTGTILGDRYEILEKIGTGGMAEVFKGKDHKLNRYVAVKVLKEEFRDNDGFVKKFKEEAQAAAGLAHPNIVNVYDVAVAKANVSTYFPSAYTLYVCPLSICSFV